MSRLAQRLVGRIADNRRADSLAWKARRKRWEWLGQYFPLAEMRVLDLGGTANSWSLSPVQPAELVILNANPEHKDDAILGDACDPPAELRGERFDLVFSNSVIEHVGGHDRRQAFADVVKAFAPHHWIQTPNRYFPVEPHWLFPGVQFLPTGWKALVACKWPYGWVSPADRNTAIRESLGIELLTATELHFYLSDSEILRERAAGFTKSLIAVR